MYPMDRTVPVKEEDVDLENGIHRAYFGGAWMKVYAEKICEFYSRLGRTSFTVIRHSNIYGPHDTFDQDKAHVFAATILKVMNGKDSNHRVGRRVGAARSSLYRRPHSFRRSCSRKTEISV